MYSFVPVYNSGYSNSNCTTTNAISALIDPNTGSLRMEFTGYSGPPNASGTPSVKRTLVASFRKPSPLDYLWYTDHEMEDPQLNSNCTGEKYYWQYTPVSVHHRQQLRDQLDHRRHDGAVRCTPTTST